MLRVKGNFAGQYHKETTWNTNRPILSLTFLDVGEGDSTVIRFPDRRVWVLDAGGLRNYSPFTENSRGLDTGEAIVSRYLWQGWIGRLDRLILSHTDTDHAGGVPALIKNFEIGTFHYSAACRDQVMEKIIDIAHGKRLSVHPLHEGMKEHIGRVELSILNPPVNSSLRSANENSIVIGLRFGSFSALLPGDLEREGEMRLLRHHGNQRARLLKVAHHGSRTSTSAAFIESVKPRWGVISAGRYNTYGHPSELVVERLHRYGTKVFSTIDEGAITFETDGTRYRIKSYLSGILEQGFL
jgi:competence protein ComEC